MALTSLISSLRLTTFLTSGNPRVSMAVMNIHVQPPTVSRLSMVVTNVHVAPPTTARLSQVVLNTWVSLDQGIRIPNEVFGGNQVFTPSFTTELQLDNPEPPVVEVNPYQANTPNVDHQRIMREQHNLLQAGDSTFHWGVLTDIYAEPKYTLGSLGRFYHDQLGMIHARFVKFVDLVKCDSKGFPVGWHTSKRELWTVTNQLSKSSQLYAIGVAIPYNELAFQGDCYGWVIVDGLVPVEMDIALDSTPIMFGTEYGWSDTGKIKPSITGYSLGIRFTTEKLPTLPIGTFKVELEKLSQVRLAGIITTKLAPLSTALGALTTRVSTLETTVGGHTTQISGLTSRVDALELSLASEIKSLSDSLAQIRRQIPDSDFVGYVNTAISNLKGYVDANNTVIGTVANNALLRANAAYALAESTSYAAVQAQIDAINTAMGGITDRLIGFTANIDTNTLTAGQVLVSYLYATDAFGVKFFDFRPLDFEFNALLDVDVSTPPTDGQVPIWDNAAQKWIPGDMTGGGGGGGGETPWELIQDYTITGSIANHDVDVTGYTDVMCVFLDVTASASGSRSLQVSTNGGASFHAAVGDYNWLSFVGVKNNNDSFAVHGVSTASARSGVGRLYATNDGSGPKVWETPNNQDHGAGLFVASNNPITHVRYLMKASGNMTGGRLITYGRPVEGAGGSDDDFTGWEEIDSWHFSITGAISSKIVNFLDYKDILIIGTGVTASNSGWRGGRFSVNGGATYVNTASYQSVTTTGNFGVSDTGAFFHATAATGARNFHYLIDGRNLNGIPKRITSNRTDSTGLFGTSALGTLGPITHIQISNIDSSGAVLGTLTGGDIWVLGRK